MWTKNQREKEAHAPDTQENRVVKPNSHHHHNTGGSEGKGREPLKWTPTGWKDSRGEVLPLHVVDPNSNPQSHK